jgi:hypothetical protein
LSLWSDLYPWILFESSFDLLYAWLFIAMYFFFESLV